MRVVSIYARILQQRGHDVTLVYPRPSRTSLRKWLRAILRERRFEAFRSAARSHLDGIAVEHRIIAAGRPIRDEDVPDADVVIAVWYPSAQAIAGFSRAKGRQVALLQGYELNGTERDQLIREVWAHPMQKIVVSQWLADIARTEYGDSSAIIVPNAVDHEIFDAAPRSKQPRTTVGFIYGLGLIKRTSALLDACETSLREVPELRVIAFGPRLKDRRHRLPDFVEYTSEPAQESLPKLYGQCDAWIVASESEGFGLPILEAMACRTPVISTSVGIAPDVLSDGAGILVSRSEPAELTRAIREIHGLSNEAWFAMSSRAHAVAASYDWSDSADRFERALADIAGRG